MKNASPAVTEAPTASLVALQAASQNLARAQIDEQEILQHLQQEARSVLPPGRIHIVLFEPDRTELYAWDRRGNALPPSYFESPAGKGIVGWLRQTKESLLVRDFIRDWDSLPAKPSYDNPDPPRSALFVPLVVADEALGAISVQSDQPDIFTPDHLWQLRILANQTAAALRAGRLLQSERWRANQLQTLAEVTRSVVSILDLDELLTRVVDIIEEAFDYYHVQVFVSERGSDVAQFRASSGRTTHDLWRKIGRTVGIGEGMIGWVLQHGETVIAPDVSIDPLYIPDDPRLLPDTRSEIALPLKIEDTILGVLDVQSDQLDAFNREDVFILNALADAVALAVANARLYSRVQEDAWITTALLEVAEATNRLTELEDVVETISRITPLLTGVVSTAIWLKEANADAFRPAGQWGIHDETVRLFYKHPLLADENPAIRVVEETQRPLVLRSPELDELLNPIIAQTLLADAIVLLPLLAKGKLTGIMAVSVDEDNAALSETRTFLLKGIADQAASAIENAQLIAAQQEEAWISTALLQVAQAMGRAGDLPDTLTIVARLTATLSGLDRCTILLRQQGDDDDYHVSFSYSLSKELPAVQLNAVVDSGDLPLLDELVKRREPVILLDARENDLIPDYLIETLKIGAVIALPLVANNEVVGALIVDEIEARRAHNPRILDILNGIANQAAIAIERARLQRAEIEQQRIATELGVARNIQQGFFPESLPDLAGYEVAAIWEPARQIGGDFYDFIPIDNDRMGIVIADVADKGIPAALYMALSRTTMRLVATRDPSPSVALQRVNTAILDTTYSDLFVSVYYAVLDLASHQITYASGGHGLALKASERGITFLRGRGTVLGIFPTIHIEEHTAELAPGDYFILYTDGVCDAVNEDMEDFGEGRLSATILKNLGLPAQEILKQIHAEVRAWEGIDTSFDDFTLVVVRRQPLCG